MYTVCYSKRTGAGASYRSAVESKRLLGVPVRTRATNDKGAASSPMFAAATSARAVHRGPALSIQNRSGLLPHCSVRILSVAGLRRWHPRLPSSTPLAITTTSLPQGTVQVSYSATLAAMGGTGSGYAWSLSAGALPGGITLAGGGILAGTPTATGTFNFTAKLRIRHGLRPTASLSLVIADAGPLTNYEFTGDTSPVHDPSIIRQGSTYYVFSTDASSSQGGFIPIRCSTDKIAWTACGYVFSTLPSWISRAVPQATEIWAPDVSYFNSHLSRLLRGFFVWVECFGNRTGDQHHAGFDRSELQLGRSGPYFAVLDSPTTSTPLTPTFSSTQVDPSG